VVSKRSDLPKRKKPERHLPSPSPDGGRGTLPRCIHCGARDAEVISLFGTQAMTLQYRCRRCGTLFEAIKYD
jgi:DNA-directed RNA polymerase subunit RPC12/RpoP